MKNFAKLQAQHEALLEKVDSSQNKKTLAKSVQKYIETISAASTNIESQQQRDQLRVILRFWAAFIFEQTGTYPTTTIRPFTGQTGSKKYSGKNFLLIYSTQMKTSLNAMKQWQKVIVGGLIVMILLEWCVFILLIAT